MDAIISLEYHLLSRFHSFGRLFSILFEEDWSMPFTITPLKSTGPHQWGIAVAKCNLDDNSDLLVNTIVDLVRESYGEYALMSNAEALLSDDIVSGTFDLKNLLAAVREGFPDPEQEGNKPPHLTTYRSQAAEMVAKAVLSRAYRYEYPVSPQQGTPNPNQPILGFDGWGFVEGSDGTLSFALIQVKATDSKKSPPPDASKLAEECKEAPREIQAVLRALAIIYLNLHDSSFCTTIAKMMVKVRRRETIPILISPVIVRGMTIPALKDLDPITSICDELQPACMRGMVVSIGTKLDEFGYLVMRKAREVT